MRFDLNQDYINAINKELQAAKPGTDLGNIKGFQRTWQPLYDTQAIGGSGDFLYFKGSNGKPKSQTNFDGQNQLDAPRHFLVCGISLHADAMTEGADLAKIVNNGVFRLLLGDIPMLELPLSIFANLMPVLNDPGDNPAGTKAWGQTSHDEGFYTLVDPLLLAPGKNFKPIVTVDTLASPLGAPVNLKVALTGFLFRK